MPMVKRSTLILKLDNIGKEPSEPALESFDDISLSPSESTIRNIMAFARAHRSRHSKIGTLEMVLN